MEAKQTSGVRPSPVRTTRVRSITRRPRRRQIAEQIRQEILTGHLSTNGWGTIKELADRFSVSSTPVREALVLLSEEGFVELRPRMGFRAKSLAPVDVQSLFAAYGFVSGLLAEQARLGEQEITELETYIFEMDALDPAEDASTLQHLNWLFHRTIQRTSPTYHLKFVARNLLRNIPWLTHLPMTAEWMARAQDQHRSMVRVLRHGDTATLRLLTEDHARIGSEHLMTYLYESGLWAEWTAGSAETSA